MYFTTEEYAQMVEEVLGETPKFTTLFLITYKVFEARKKVWGSKEIYNDADLQCRIQTAFEAKVLKGTHGFLLPGGPGSALVFNPAGYHAWLCAVVDSQKNGVITPWFKKRNAQDGLYDKEGNEIDLPDSDGDISDRVISEELAAECFRRVLDSDVGVYKTLAWLAHRLYVLQGRYKASKCSEVVSLAFSEYTLNAMWEKISAVAGRISWMEISDRQRSRIEERLVEISDRGVPYGQMKFKDLFMKKGGTASVSDWINRIDKGLWCSMPEAVEKLPAEKKKKTDGTPGGGKTPGSPAQE